MYSTVHEPATHSSSGFCSANSCRSLKKKKIWIPSDFLIYQIFWISSCWKPSRMIFISRTHSGPGQMSGRWYEVGCRQWLSKISIMGERQHIYSHTKIQLHPWHSLCQYCELLTWEQPRTSDATRFFLQQPKRLLPTSPYPFPSPEHLEELPTQCKVVGPWGLPEPSQHCLGRSHQLSTHSCPFPLGPINEVFQPHTPWWPMP